MRRPPRIFASRAPRILIVALVLLGCEGELGAGPAGPRGTGSRDPDDPAELSIQPSSVRRLAEDFDLMPGLQNLRKFAGLKSINPSVPVSAVLIFTAR